MGTVPPERGPAVLLLSGGAALRPLSRELKKLTFRSIHLVAPFDSGGKSGALRDAFQMPAITALRHRLSDLADDGPSGQAFVRFAGERFAAVAAPGALTDRLGQLVRGTSPLVTGLPRALGDLIRADLGCLARNMPNDFDLRGASAGDLTLIGGYLRNDRDLGRALANLTSSAAIRGIVRPSTEASAHLAARLEGGRTLVSQHRISARGMLSAPIRELIAVAAPSDPRVIAVDATPLALKLISQAELITYPLGGFFTSVLANVVPTGVGTAIAASTRRKVYIPSPGTDPEQMGQTLATSLEAIVAMGRRDAGADLPATAFVDTVLLDREHGHYDLRLDVPRVKRLGVDVIERDLTGGDGVPLSPVKLARTLVGL